MTELLSDLFGGAFVYLDHNVTSSRLTLIISLAQPRLALTILQRLNEPGDIAGLVRSQYQNQNLRRPC
jgi:hypothetical protein